MREARGSLEDARQAYAECDWAAAIAAYEVADAEAGLGPDDLACWSRSAWWLARLAESIALGERAFAGYRDADRADDAVATALRVALLRMVTGDLTVGAAWRRRAEALLAGRPEGVLHGYLGTLQLAFAMMEGSEQWSAEGVHRLGELARRLGDPTVATLHLAMSGTFDVRAGRTARGFAQLDEAMLRVLSSEIEPEWGGEVFCNTIDLCHELADYRRMSDWTRATEQWCRRIGSDAVYSGVCRVHRLELRSAAGDWEDVENGLIEVCDRLEHVNRWVAGEGWYSSASSSGCAVTPPGLVWHTRGPASSASIRCLARPCSNSRRATGSAPGTSSRPPWTRGTAWAARDCCVPRWRWRWRTAARRRPRASGTSCTGSLGSTTARGSGRGPIMRTA